MSNVLSNRAWAAPCESVYEQIILVFLANCMNDLTGKCFPSINTIRKACKISRSTAHESLKKLRAKGLISWETGNEKKSNRYSLTLPQEAKKKGIPAPGIPIPGGGIPIPGGGPEPLSNPEVTPRGKAPLFINELVAQKTICEKRMRKLEDNGSNGNGDWHNQEMRKQHRELRKQRDEIENKILSR